MPFMLCSEPASNDHFQTQTGAALCYVSCTVVFLGSQDHNPLKLKGIVEADETYVLESRKGERNLDRKVRRRGGKANKRGLSDEQVPILFAVDRSGTTTCSVLPSVTADNVQDILEPRINDDIILVTDGNNIYPPRAKSPGIKHEALNISAGERKRGVFNISRVNNRHSLFKDFLRRYHGVSSKYLGNYLLWFERYVLLKLSPRSYLATAIMVQVYDLRTALYFNFLPCVPVIRIEHQALFFQHGIFIVGERHNDEHLLPRRPAEPDPIGT